MTFSENIMGKLQSIAMYLKSVEKLRILFFSQLSQLVAIPYAYER